MFVKLVFVCRFDFSLIETIVTLQEKKCSKDYVILRGIFGSMFKGKNLIVLHSVVTGNNLESKNKMAAIYKVQKFQGR
jgi:hypothetical protein